jgi:membrane fusion protein, heavy metal efflux system
MAITTRLFIAARLTRRGVLQLRQHAVAAGAMAALAALAMTPAQISAQSAKLPARPAPIGCLISPERVADVGSPVIGIVSKVKVDVGDPVREGQTLVLLRADVERASEQAASARATIDADVLAAEANLALATQRHTRARDLQAQGFVSAQATDQARAEQDVALQKLRQAKGQLKVAGSDLGVVRAQAGQRKVKSSFEGVVIERYVQAGERVDDKPLLRIAKLDPLRVELVVPAGRYGSIALKDMIRVAPDLPGVAPVQARVTHIDPIIDAASNTFRVRLKLPNPDHKLPGGARCRVELAPVGGVAPAATPAARGEVIGKVNG